MRISDWSSDVCSSDLSKKGDLQGAALLSWHNEAGTIGLLASFQRAKDRLRRHGLESYGTIAADFWDGINDAKAGSRPQDAYPVPADPAEARVSGSGNCIDACATTLASNPGARFDRKGTRLNP